MRGCTDFEEKQPGAELNYLWAGVSLEFRTASKDHYIVKVIAANSLQPLLQPGEMSLAVGAVSRGQKFNCRILRRTGFTRRLMGDSTYVVPEMFHLVVEGKQKGPYTLSQIRGMWERAELTADVVYWKEGMDGWLPLVELIEKATVPPSDAQSKQTEVNKASDHPSSSQQDTIPAKKTKNQRIDYSTENERWKSSGTNYVEESKSEEWKDLMEDDDSSEEEIDSQLMGLICIGYSCGPLSFFCLSGQWVVGCIIGIRLLFLEGTARINGIGIIVFNVVCFAVWSYYH